MTQAESSCLERSVDARVAVARLIEAMSNNRPEVSNLITQALHPLFAKETSEPAISAMIDALMVHQSVLLNEGAALDVKISTLVTSGLSERRNKLKSAWAVSISQVIWNFDDPTKVNQSVIAFSKSLGKPLCAAFHEIASNGVQAAQNGTIISGYAISAAALGRWLDWSVDELTQLVKAEGILNMTIAVAPKPSFLLNDRIYTKLTNIGDQLWAIHALEAAAKRAIAEMETAWPLAAIYFVVNPKLQKEVRFSAIDMLKKLLLKMLSEDRIQAADYIIRGVEEWLHQLSEERKEGSPAAVGEASLSRLKDVITALLSRELTSDKSYVNHVLRRMFVLAHHPRLADQRWSWIDISRHAKVDPGQLATEMAPEFLESIFDKLWPKERVINSFGLAKVSE